MEWEEAFWEKLSRLRLHMGQKSALQMAGNRKSVHKGFSAEFSDFREYRQGDDLRHIDWNVYGRLDKLYVKEYSEEKEALVNILLDTSASMKYGEKKKSDLACRLAAAIAYLGQNGMDRVYLYDMQRMQHPFTARGKHFLWQLQGWLEQCSFEGETSIKEAVMQLPAQGPGMTILISDFWQEDFVEDEQKTVEELLCFLKYRKQSSVWLQVLAEEEITIEWTGTRKLIDMETGQQLPMLLDRDSIAEYEKTLQTFLLHLHQECDRAGAFYALCSTGKAWEQLLFQDLRMLYDI